MPGVPSHDLDIRVLAETYYLQTLHQLSEANMDQPSSLPGWTRKHVAMHMVHNADALMRLLDWAETGVRTPMYASRAARDAEIEESVAHTSGADAITLSSEVAEELAGRLAGVEASAWDAEVESGQGEPIPAGDVPWMRARECWLHALDLNIGMSALDFPAEVSERILDDVVRTWEDRGDTAHFLLEFTDRTDAAGAPLTRLVASGDPTTSEPVRVTGRTGAIASYLAGRGWPEDTDQDLPTPPPFR